MGEMAQDGAKRQELAQQYGALQGKIDSTKEALKNNPPKNIGEMMTSMVTLAAQEQALAAINAKAAELKSYVVHGAQTICEHGTRSARLIVPISHGVYLRNKAQLNRWDYMPTINVNCMGNCVAGYMDICEEQEAKKTEKKTFGESFFSFIDSIFTSKEKKESAKSAQREKAASSVQSCTYDPITTWLDTKEDVLIEGRQALLNTSYVICAKGGKVIIVDDGQIDREQNSE